jgi:hypothetical protein
MKGKKAVVARNFAVRLKCPHGDADELLILRDREESLEQIQTSPWHFECPVHGVQREVPVAAKEIIRGYNPAVQLRPKPGEQPLPKPGSKMSKAQRRSKRISFRVPVLVYGRNRKLGAFHEQTFTRVVNAQGGSVALTAAVTVGETLLVVNAKTQAEQLCRVASTGPVEGVGKNVGLAFLRAAPNFWGLVFPSSV